MPYFAVNSQQINHSMSRQENIPRLSSTNLKKKAPDYIHLSILLKDIDEAIKNHASGDLLDLGCGNKPYEEWYQPKTKLLANCEACKR